MKNRDWKKGLLAFWMVVALAAPVFALGSDHKIYVDDDAKGTQNGSGDHPFKTINQALDISESGDKIIVRKGTYKENFTIPKGVRVVGADRDKTIVKADHKNDVLVIMKHDTKLQQLTIEGGRHGILVKEDSRAEITEVKVKNSEREGIVVLKAPTEKKYKVSIVNCEVRDSERAGIFSERREVVVIKSNIHGNGGDGVILDDNGDAWIEKNKIHDNEKSGIKIYAAGAKSSLVNNFISNNVREGIEVDSSDAIGSVDIYGNTIQGNGRYGIARIVRELGSMNGIAVRTDNVFGDNFFGGVSHIIRL